MQNLGLSQLLAPVSTATFFASHWPGKPLLVPPVGGKLAGLFALPELQSLESLLAHRQQKVRACLPDFEDEYSSLLVEPNEAERAYRNHMTLVFDSMQTQVAYLAETLEQVRAELGLPARLVQSRAIVYATPAGGRTRLHFDANANFVIQLQGTKRWRLAPNTSVENPTDRYTSGTGEISTELDSQCHAQLLDELPEDCEELVLQPGSVLFVPRGYWHETSTEEDSFSITLTFSQPTWADVFATALHRHLLQERDWREVASEKAPDRLESLVKKLAAAFPSIDLS